MPDRSIIAFKIDVLLQPKRLDTGQVSALRFGQYHQHGTYIFMAVVAPNDQGLTTQPACSVRRTCALAAQSHPPEPFT